MVREAVTINSSAQILSTEGESNLAILLQVGVVAEIGTALRS
jgi:hypothetical protein